MGIWVFVALSWGFFHFILPLQALDLAEDLLLVVGDDVIYRIVVLNEFLVMTPALIRTPAPDKLGHQSKNLAFSSTFLFAHDLEVILEEVDVFDLLFSWPLALPSFLFQECFHADSMFGQYLVFDLSFLFYAFFLIVAVDVELHRFDSSFENDYKSILRLRFSQR